MGSGSGSNHSSKSLSELQSDRKKREEQDNYERNVNEFFDSLLKMFNERDIEQIHKHLNTLKSALENDIESSLEMKFGGSINKHTYVNGLSDIDMLVQINDSDYQNKSPKEVLEKFSKTLQKRLPNTDISVGKLAVTVKYSNGNEIQLLPSLKTSIGYKIASMNSEKWSNVIKPKKFAEKLSAVNKMNGNKVVPAIKLFKSINAKLPKENQVSGYHIESLAINAFKDNSSIRTYKGMVEHFIRYSKGAVLTPVKDSTGQSIHVDDYLGESNSIERRRVSNSLRILEKKISKANNSIDQDIWKELINKN